jgi:hypothetical protein
MIGCRHDAPSCTECDDVGFVTDPRSADEDGLPDLLPCPRSCGASAGHMVRGLDEWKCTLPVVDERELEAERAAVLSELDDDEEREPVQARRLGPVTWPLEEGDDIQW